MKIRLSGTGFSPEKTASLADGKLIRSSNEYADSQILTLATDSREAEKGTLFIALKGETSDGHCYIVKALDNGAFAVLAEHLPQGFCGTAILVPDTLKALRKMAVRHKEEVSPLTVAVTGSVGKTTTKELIFSALNHEKAYNAHKSAGNFNTEIGLLLTMMELDKSNTALVAEMGMSAKGEISVMSAAAKPDIAVITNIGTSHIEKLGSRENIRDAKLEITHGLKNGGKLILNGDEPLLSGIDGAVYVSGKDISDIHDSEEGMHYSFRYNGIDYKDICIPIHGEHAVFDSALAFAAAYEAGVRPELIIEGFGNYQSVGMRQNIYVLNGWNIIEDCYNSSPESAEASLRVLKSTAERNHGRAVAVLGDMRELGAMSPELHRKVGEAAGRTGIDKLITFGRAANEIAKGFNGDSESFENLEDVGKIGDYIIGILENNDTVLFKASRAVELERVIKYIKNLRG